MNTQEACDILGIKPGDSREIADKSFRNLAAKFHPDKVKGNKDAAEKQFKKISEAYQFVKENGTNVHSHSGNMPEDVEEFFRRSGIRVNFHRQEMRPRVLVGFVDLTFSDSITGCRKAVSFSRNVMCPHCPGAECSKCFGQGFFSEIKDTEIELPGGVENGSYAKIENEGGVVNGMTADAILEIHVESDPDLSRVGLDVISNITVSLLDALKGTSIDTRTAFGNKTLKIKSGIKNGDTVRVRGFGVAKQGSHIFKVRVDYPNDTTQLIKALENYPESDLEEIEGD